jgi:hypothetical protein
MNWKNILTKGLPVVGILVAVFIGFAVASRPKAVPKVSNPNESVVSFHDLEIKKIELYELMKTNYALNIILQEVDSTVLADYYDDVDEAELTKEIDELKGEDEQKFYDDLVYVGYVKSETETQEAFETRIRSYYKYALNLVQKVAATEIAKAEILEESQEAKTLNSDNVTTNDKVDIVEDAKLKYSQNRDICVIPLEYETYAEQTAVISQVKDLTGDVLEAKFEELWLAQQADEEDVEEEEETDDEVDFFEDKITCEYERVIYKEQTNTTYRDFIFGVNLDTYSNKIISNKYYVVYKSDVARNPLTDYTADEKVEFETIIIDNLVSERATAQYIKDTVTDLRNNAGFKIFDYVLADQYASTDADFEVSKNKNKQAVYELNGKVVTADQLYEKLKVSGALSLSMDKVNYAALSQIEAIQLNKKEMEANKDQIAAMKAEFLNQGYDMTWSDYIKLFGANSVDELGNLIALDQLTTRYVLGYTVDDEEKYVGVAPVLQSEIDEMYEKWFEITASHILFKVDEEAEDLQVEKDRANLLAKQVIRGVDYEADKATALLTEDEFISYDYDGDGKVEIGSEIAVEDREYFKGLINTPAADYSKVFSALAKEYSDDGSATSGGSLGAFGPEKMVKEFEDAAKKISARRDEFPFSNLDDATIADTEFGIHVIYVTAETVKPVAPEDYKESTIDQIRTALASETNTQLKTYFDFIVKFETTLEEEHLSPENVQKHMAQLLQTQEFKFKDSVIQTYYQKIVEVQLRVKAE